MAREGGYDAVQVREIIRLADVAVGTLYRHFSSRDHILASIQFEWLVSLTTDNHGLVAAASPPERAADLTSHICRALTAEPRLSRAILVALASSDSRVRQVRVASDAVVMSAFSEMLGLSSGSGAESLARLRIALQGALFSWAHELMNIAEIERALVLTLESLPLTPTDVRTAPMSDTSDVDEIRRELDRLRAKEQITDRLLGYARGADRIDLDLIRSTFHPGAIADYGDMFQGTAEGFADFIGEVHPPMKTHTHHLSNISVTVDGDRAGSETYVIMRACTVGVDGVVHDTGSYGRYLDEWERLNGEWRINHRRYLHSLDQIEEVTLALFEPTGTRDQSDPSYPVLRGPVSSSDDLL